MSGSAVPGLPAGPNPTWGGLGGLWKVLQAIGSTPTAQSVASGATLPGDVYGGTVPMGMPSETPDLSRVADLAGLATLGGMPMAPKGALRTGPSAEDAIASLEKSFQEMTASWGKNALNKGAMAPELTPDLPPSGKIDTTSIFQKLQAMKAEPEIPPMPAPGSPEMHAKIVDNWSNPVVQQWLGDSNIPVEDVWKAIHTPVETGAKLTPEMPAPVSGAGIFTPTTDTLPDLSQLKGIDKELFSELFENKSQLIQEEITFLKNHAPDALLWAQKNGMVPIKSPAPPSVHAPSDPSFPFADRPEQRASRLFYPDELIGPPIPDRDLPNDLASRMERARQMGFNTEQKLYTGVPTWGVDAPIGFKDPATKEFEPAIFLANNSKVPESYNKGRGVTMPLYAKMENPMVHDWKGMEYDGGIMNALIREAKAEGHDSAIMKNMKDLGGLQDQYLAFDPNQLRSIFAKFDPKNAASPDLAAGLAALLGLPAAALQLPQEPKS